MLFDLHMHSQYSFDSDMEIFRMFETAVKRGLNGIAITDHETLEGGRAARQLGSPNLKIIPGIEIHSDIGDIIGLFVEEDIDTTNPFDIVDAIHDQDGIAIIPHPFRGRGKIPAALLDKLDGIECYNARYYSSVPPARQLASDHLQLLAKEHGLAVIGASDAHSYPEIGMGSTEMNAITTEDIKRCIRQRETSLGPCKTSKKKRLSSAVNSLFFPKAEQPGRCIVKNGGLYETRRVQEVDNLLDQEDNDYREDRQNPYGIYER